MPRWQKLQTTTTPEKYLKKSDFLEIIGTSLNILSKKPENEAEDILQRINAAFTSQKPIRNDTILNIDFSTGNSSSTPRTRSGEPDTEAGNENLSFNEEIDFNSNILQTSGFSDFIASLTPPRMSSTHDQAILLPPRLSPSADINVIQIPSRSSSTTDIHTTLTPPTVTASTSTAHATQPLPELLPVSTDLQIPATSSIPSQPNKLEDILNWPLTPKRKGKRNVSRDSYVVSSKQWQNEQEEKIQAKEKMLKEKEEKKQRRKENKVKKSEAQKKKAQKIKKPRVLSSDSSESSAEVSSGESDWEEPSENEDSKEHGWIAPQRSVDEYVVTKYDNRFFPGKILSVSETEATVTCMMKCGRLWKWPERPDILNYGWDSVVSHINEPKKVSKTRNVYSVPELENVWH